MGIIIGLPIDTVHRYTDLLCKQNYHDFVYLVKKQIPTVVIL